MQFAEKNAVVLRQMYEVEKLSAAQIAKHLNTYPKKVLRALEHLNVPRRGYSEAQSNAIESGAAKGSRKLAETSADPDDHGKLVDGLQELTEDEWKGLSKAERQVILDGASDALALERKHDNRARKHLRDNLRKLGYEVQNRNPVANSQLSGDLFVMNCGSEVVIKIYDQSQHSDDWGKGNNDEHQKVAEAFVERANDDGFRVIEIRPSQKIPTVQQLEEITIEVDRIIQEILGSPDGKSSDEYLYNVER